MTTANAAHESRALSLELIDDPVLPSRSEMDDQKLEELTESVRAVGLIEPIIVRPVEARFEVIAGHRRLIACRRAGLAAVPCIVRHDAGVSRILLQAHENSRREDLNPADEAIWFAELLEKECDGDIEKLCGLVGEKLSYVDGRLALHRGDEAVFAALQRGYIKIGVAHELNKCTNPHYRKYFLECAIKGGATVGLVSGWIIEWKQNLGSIPQGPITPTDDAPGISAEIHSPFTCIICGKANNVHLIRQVSVHQHCHMAILDPLLAQARGDG